MKAYWSVVAGILLLTLVMAVAAPMFLISTGGVLVAAVIAAKLPLRRYATLGLSPLQWTFVAIIASTVLFGIGAEMLNPVPVALGLAAFLTPLFFSMKRSAREMGI